MEHKNRPDHAQDDSACADLPELKRNNYFHGQMLGVNDFRTEQHYFREKLKLHNRCLHGYGTVCGLMVSVEPAPQHCDDDQDRERKELAAGLAPLEGRLEQLRKARDSGETARLEKEIAQVRHKLEALGGPGGVDAASSRVAIACGLALDCEGNEIIVSRPYRFDPWQLLSQDDRKLVLDNGAAGGEGTDLYLSICYCEQAADPARPVLPGACGGTAECNASKLRDGFRLRLSAVLPDPDTRCGTCCASCGDACLLLAVLVGWRKGQPIASIDNSVRRLVASAAYAPTTITGISWTHGATYTSGEASAILGRLGVGRGIQVDFSRPVLASTLADGVVELSVLEGGKTRNAGVYYLEGKFKDLGENDSATSFRFIYLGDENLDPGDRVLITVRCAFILDECCRPVDGAHVGGRVPLIADFKEFDRSTPPARCVLKPPGYGPWTSGAGTPGSTFESWFFIKQEDEGETRRVNKEPVK